MLNVQLLSKMDKKIFWLSHHQLTQQWGIFGLILFLTSIFLLLFWPPCMYVQTTFHETPLQTLGSTKLKKSLQPSEIVVLELPPSPPVSSPVWPISTCLVIKIWKWVWFRRILYVRGQKQTKCLIFLNEKNTFLKETRHVFNSRNTRLGYYGITND